MHAYEKIFGKLEPDELDKMIKANIPVFEHTGIIHEMSEEEKAEAEKVLMEFITGKRKIGK